MFAALPLDVRLRIYHQLEASDLATLERVSSWLKEDVRDYGWHEHALPAVHCFHVELPMPQDARASRATRQIVRQFVGMRRASHCLKSFSETDYAVSFDLHGDFLCISHLNSTLNEKTAALSQIVKVLIRQERHAEAQIWEARARGNRQLYDAIVRGDIKPVQDVLRQHFWLQEGMFAAAVANLPAALPLLIRHMPRALVPRVWQAIAISPAALVTATAALLKRGFLPPHHCIGRIFQHIEDDDVAKQLAHALTDYDDINAAKALVLILESADSVLSADVLSARLVATRPGLLVAFWNQSPNVSDDFLRELMCRFAAAGLKIGDTLHLEVDDLRQICRTGGVLHHYVKAAITMDAPLTLLESFAQQLFMEPVTDRMQCLRLLLDCGVAPETGVRSRRTLLHRAAAAGDEESARLLLARGAKVGTRDRHKRTAAQIARRGKRIALANLLSGEPTTAASTQPPSAVTHL